MADLGSRTNLDTAINTLLDDAQPNEAIQPSDHNTLLKNALDTVANGLPNTLRTNPETSGQDLEVTSGDKIKFKNSGFVGSLVSGTLTADKTYTLPDNTGTIALLSDITGGDSIYTADDTIGSGRVATLTDSLRFDNVGTTSSDFIEFKHANNASLLTFLRFYNALESKYTDIGCAGNTSIFNIKSNTNNVADFQSNRTFFYGASSGYIKLETNVSGADNWKLMADRQNQGQGFNIENETTGNYGLHIKKDNTFVVRAYNPISTEKISFQGSTLIKGDGTSTGSALSLYDNDTTPNKRFEILDNGQFRLDSSNAVVATPVLIEMRPIGGTGTKPYFKIKNYGEVEILGGLSNLFNVQNTLGAKQFEVLNGVTKINGSSEITASFFKVSTDTQKMSFNAGSGGALHHEIKTNGGGGPITTRFNIPGGTSEFIVGGSAVIGTEKISLQGDTLLMQM